MHGAGWAGLQGARIPTDQHPGKLAEGAGLVTIIASEITAAHGGRINLLPCGHSDPAKQGTC